MGKVGVWTGEEGRREGRRCSEKGGIKLAGKAWRLIKPIKCHPSDEYRKMTQSTRVFLSEGNIAEETRRG